MFRLILITFIVSFGLGSIGQTYHHSIGLGFATAYESSSNNDPNVSISSSSINGSLGLRYMAALKWPVNEKIDFVTSIDPFLFALPFNTGNGLSMFGSFDIPLEMKLYFGGIENTAFFAGAGADYYWLNWRMGEKWGAWGFGPQTCIGFSNRKGKFGISGRASFTYGLKLQNSTARKTMFSLSISLLLPTPGVNYNTTDKE